MPHTRLPKGALIKLSKASGLPKTTIHSYITRDRGVTPEKAIKLEAICKRNGLNLTKEQWVFEKTEGLKEAIKKWFEKERRQSQM